MESLALSLKKYRALMQRLDQINKDVSSIKLKGLPEAGYIDNHDLLMLLKVSLRTLQRWRKNGKLPYRKLGNRFYYKADLILERFKLNFNEQVEDEKPPPVVPPLDENELHITCERCPLFVILNSED